MQTFGIGEVARKTGITDSTIRYYERIGLLPPCRRVSGKRRYDDAVFQKLSVIRLAQRAGLTIAEIQTLLHDFPADTPPSQRWGALAGAKIAEMDELLQRVQAMKSLLEQTLACQCPTLNDCARIEESAAGETLISPGC